MSGIFGVIGLYGAPADRQLLQRMTDAMSFRGPDAKSLWSDKQVGFGNTQLSTTFESKNERQPTSLDGKIWVTADVRLDGRADLIRKLASRTEIIPRDVSDAELILYAYRRWGNACVDNLIGDFSFALWDKANQRLFCARDHFGVKPFHYALTSTHFVFSNTLNCVRMHPAVSSELNELAIADFLLLGFHRDTSTTSFEQIRRLPPAHTLELCGSDFNISRYWNLPVDKRIHHSTPGDYVDHFREVFDTAVSDRLRTNRAGIQLSGGVDSSSIAVTARAVQSGQSVPCELEAWTEIYERIVESKERPFAELVAESLNIPIHFCIADDYQPFDNWRATPEPLHDPLYFALLDHFNESNARNRVVLCGQGADEVLYRSLACDLLGNMPLAKLIVDVSKCVLLHGKRPAVGVRGLIRRSLGEQSPNPRIPPWINEDFGNDNDLGNRVSQANSWDVPRHPLRPDAVRMLTQPLLPDYFESRDPGMTGVPIEIRYPFLDVRLVTYMLSIPPIPWCVDKYILRQAMKHRLPEPVRLRPKTPLSGDPVYEHLKSESARWMNRMKPVPPMERFIDMKKVPPASPPASDPDESWLNLRPLSIEYWLKSQHAIGHPATGASE